MSGPASKKDEPEEFSKVSTHCVRFWSPVGLPEKRPRKTNGDGTHIACAPGQCVKEGPVLTMDAIDRLGANADNGIDQYRKLFKRRVAFVAHALFPTTVDYRITMDRAAADRLTAADATTRTTKFLSFPVSPAKGRPVWVDFFNFPTTGENFLQATREERTQAPVAAWARQMVESARRDGIDELTIGWGAFTKIATEHGKSLVSALEAENERSSRGVRGRLFGRSSLRISSTHGDAGTIALTLDLLRLAGIGHGKRIAIIGANGVIGEGLAHAIQSFRPASVLLVGRADDARSGETRKQRLEKLRQSVIAGRTKTSEIVIHQDKSRACLEHRSEVVIVATSGMDLSGREVPRGALVVDICTPSACRAGSDWKDRLVLSAGCGVFDKALTLPFGYGHLGSERLFDVGAGGRLTLWGCTAESIARGVFGFKGHVAGQSVTPEEVKWCSEAFAAMGIRAQDPVSFGKRLDWETVRDFTQGPRTQVQVKMAVGA